MSISRRHVLAMTAGAAFPRPASSAAATFCRARGKDIVSPTGEKLHLRGINLGNWLVPEGYMFLFDGGPQSGREIEAFIRELVGPAAAQAFWNEYRRTFITPADIAFIARCGFNSVRIPLHWKFFADKDADGFRLLDPIIEACRTHKLWVILDLHAAPGGQTGTNIDDSDGYPWLYESRAHQDQLVDIWPRIARRFHDDPIILGYDLLNEPVPHYPRLRQYDSALEPLYKRVTAAIRTVDRNHAIILEGAQWASNFKVFGPPFDDNLIYQFHKYWVAADQTAVQEYVDFRDRHNVPIWLGESGENSDEWIAQFRAVLDKNDIGWCFWPYKKLHKPAAVLTMKKPDHWDDITKLGAMPSGTGNAEKRIAARPTPGDAQAALTQFLANAAPDRCTVNQGFLKALGLTR